MTERKRKRQKRRERAPYILGRVLQMRLERLFLSTCFIVVIVIVVNIVVIVVIIVGIAVVVVVLAVVVVISSSLLSFSLFIVLMTLQLSFFHLESNFPFALQPSNSHRRTRTSLSLMSLLSLTPWCHHCRWCHCFPLLPTVWVCVLSCVLPMSPSPPYSMYLPLDYSFTREISPSLSASPPSFYTSPPLWFLNLSP